MNISAPFIERPIATALTMLGLLVGGLVAYPLMPVASLPNVNYPTVTVTAQLPGADPQTMAETVTSPLELQFGEIPGLTQMTSASALGYTQITLQFELSRNVDGAVSDTLSAIQTASAYLPKNIPYPPMIRKVNPANTPILVLGISSDSLPITVVDAYAQNILLQKISQIQGVGLVGIGGEQQPAVRVQVDPAALAARGINLEDVRTVLGQANVDLPKGQLNSPRQTFTFNTNDQLFNPDQYADLIIAYRNGSPLRIRDIGRAISRGQNELIAGWEKTSTRSFWRSTASPVPTSSRR
jgi:multidrug efflux pump subunit AcrB